MIDIEEECSDSNHPEESANISSNIIMVSVEFSLNEETLLFAEEVHEAVRRVEALVSVEFSLNEETLLFAEEV